MKTTSLISQIPERYTSTFYAYIKNLMLPMILRQKINETLRTKIDQKTQKVTLRSTLNINIFDILFITFIQPSLIVLYIYLKIQLNFLEASLVTLLYVGIVTNMP